MLKSIRLRVLLAVVFFVLTFIQAQAQAPTGSDPTGSQKVETAVIMGRVVRSTDGAPLKKATVMAMIAQGGQSGPMRPKSVTTDADGKFLLKDLDPGRYMLTSNRPGYARQAYGERVPMGPGTAITIIAGQQLKDITFRMVPAGVIAGRVVDEDGEPIYQARIEAQRWMYMRGKRQLIPYGSATTNDLGEYRISQLAPGRYFISANQNAFSMMPSMGSDTHEGYSQTYYPGVFDSAQADSIEVKGGNEIGGINLRLAPVRAVRIRGTVRGATGKNFAVNVQLIPKGPGLRRPEKVSAPDEQGDFELGGVLPGTYTLIAISFADEKRMYAQQVIDAADSDIDGVTLSLKPGTDIAGRIRTEGNVQTKDKPIRVALASEDFGFGGGMPAVADENLSFTLKGYSEGDYRLNVVSLPDDTYVKSANLGSRDVLDEGLRIVGTPRPLEIVISANGGRVEGAVTDSKNNPFTGARVVLVPEESRRKRQDLFKSVSTDQYGRFSIRGVTPGVYSIYAWESLDEGAYMDPDFLKMYADAGKEVRVSESSNIAMDLKVIPALAAAGN